MAGPQALNRVSAFGTVVGLDLPPAGRNLELKPYALGKMSTDRLTNPPTSNDSDGDIGGDVKYGVTANLTADLTINTDFAQVEIDEQQVNLTRFNLFLPEKREFFLEGRGLFDFGRGGARAAAPISATGGSSDTPYLFYTRRIGLNRNRVVPIDAGGRLTGKVGAFGVGVMNIQAGDEEVSASPGTNFTVLRLKRDILRRSTIGAMFTNRNKLTSNRPGDNQAYGVDAALGFYQNVALGGYYARTETTERRPATTRAIRASSTGRRIATASTPKCSRSARRSIPKSASCAAPTSRARSRRRASARGRSRRAACASTPRRPATSTTRTAPAMSSRGRRPAASTSSSTTATCSTSKRTPITTCC